MLRKLLSAILGIAAITAVLTASSTTTASATSYRNVFLVADGRQRTVLINFSDTVLSFCTDRTVSGAVQVTYVATSSSYKVSQVKFYQSSTMKTAMTPSWLAWRISSSNVMEGPVSITPSGSIPPNGWATMNAPNLYNRALTYSGSMDLELEKPGGAGCLANWNATFFKA